VSHMVIFQTPGGSPGYNQFDSLDAAVAFVEELRNDRNVENARMFALEEIKFELRPVYKVELQALTTGSGGSSGAAPQASQPAPAPAPAPQPAAAPAPAPAPEPEPKPAPSAPAAPSAPSAPSSGGFSAPPPQPSAPSQSESPSAPAPEPEQQDDSPPARRGLFGR